jgi:predicted transposase YbfD/YdcC
MRSASLSCVPYFRPLRDPRRNHRKKHLLLDIVVMALCAVIAGADDWQQVATFSRRRQAWLQTFLELPNGIPAHDTFERLFDRLDPQAFQTCFRRWVEALAHSLGLPHIAIDGKTLRHSGNAPKGWKPLHLVSAWATECHLSLGQVATEEKSNEITAIPHLLDLLDVKGALVSIDALGCQKEIARKIVGGGGDYLLSVKENQPNLLTDIQGCLEKALDEDDEGANYEVYQTEDHGHGRTETRSYVIVVEPEGIRNKEAWEQLKVVGMCRRERAVGEKRSEEASYFIGSRVMSASQYAEGLRGHWGIENNLHWQLDVVFGEDASRVQRRHGAENFALLRRMALGLLKRHPGKESIPCKRLAACADTAFLEEVLKSDSNLGNG